jgi:hypothetical protein
LQRIQDIKNIDLGTQGRLGRSDLYRRVGSQDFAGWGRRKSRGAIEGSFADTTKASPPGSRWTGGKPARVDVRKAGTDQQAARGKRTFRGPAAGTAARRICLGRAQECRGETALPRKLHANRGLIGTCFTAGSNKPRGVRVCVSAGHRSADPPVAPLTPHYFSKSQSIGRPSARHSESRSIVR